MKYPTGTKFTSSEFPTAVWTKQANGTVRLTFSDHGNTSENYFDNWDVEYPKESLFDQLYKRMK